MSINRIRLAGGYLCLLFAVGIGSSIALQHIGYGCAWAAAAVVAALTGGADWRKHVPPGTGYAFILFSGISLAGILPAGQYRLSLGHFALYFFLLLSPLAFLPFMRSGPFRRYFPVALTAGFVAGFALILFEAGPREDASFYRFAPSMGIMNYGGALGLAIPLFVAAFFYAERDKKPKLSILCNVLLFFLFLALLFNGTRIIWVSVAATTVMLAAMNLKDVNRRFYGLCLAVLAAGGIFFLSDPASLSRLTSIFLIDPEMIVARDDATPAPRAARDARPAQASRAVAKTADNTVAGTMDETDISGARKKNALSNAVRLALWRRSAEMIKQRPLLGNGYTKIPMPVWDEELNIVEVVEKDRGNVHNTFLQLGVETGILGLLAFLLIPLPSLLLAVRKARSPSSETRLWAQVLLTSLAALAIHGLTDNVLAIKSVMYLFGFLVALCWVNLAGDGRGATQSEKVG